MKRIVSYFCCFTLLISVGFAQNPRPDIRQGNKAYKSGDFEKAEEAYRESLNKDAQSFEGSFNLGNALYQKEDYEGAARQFALLEQNGEVDKTQMARVFHNRGNSFLKQQKYKESVEAFKQSLRYNPKDEDTRYNLVYAMKKLKEQQQQQQQDQEGEDGEENEDQEKKEDQEEKEGENKEENEGEENKEQEEKEGEEEQQQEQKGEDGEENEEEKQEQSSGEEGEQGEEEEQQQQSKPQENKISREDAQRLLEALQAEEQDLQDKMKKQKVKTQQIKILKDW